MGSRLKRYGIWVLVAVVGAVCWGVLALARGETINAGWLLFAAIASYAIAYRFYARFIQTRVLETDDSRATPAERLENGRDFVPMDRRILFGHHFAAIAGAGPLVGPVLAAQMGFLPGTIWIIFGVILAGAVQDMTTLFFSMRRDGKTLGQMAREEIGPVGGAAALIAVMSIMVILLAVLALVVVNALTASPWGSFSLLMTVPIAIFMGFYLRFLRPGRVIEVSLIGFALLILAIVGGGWISESGYAEAWTFEGTTITWALIIYGFVASVLPVWVLLAPRDYLSTFMKIGTVLLLAVGIALTLPAMQMPRTTQFAFNGEGPVFSGPLFPFVFIIVACGALSGFHSLIASGTTPKLIAKESQVRMIGYGAMLMESFVAVMAMIAACILDPGVYFAMNAPAGVLGETARSAAEAVRGFGFTVTPETLNQIAQNVGEESIIARTGGAPTLAVGMSQILSSLLGGTTLQAFWYHFAIMFEALFILTTVDAGTRVGRFMLQDMIGNVWRPFARTSWLPANIVASALIVAAWGYFLYAGVTDPLGGINQLFPLFGIANQLLAAVALTVGTTILIKMGKLKWAWVTALPLAWDASVTLTASWYKIFSPDPSIGFFAQRAAFQEALANGEVVAPAQSLEDMRQVVLNSTVDGILSILFALMIIIVILDAARVWVGVITGRKPAETTEAPYERSRLDHEGKPLEPEPVGAGGSPSSS
ncbi:carbon starvation protein CstA [Rubrobacter xylanophilus DSM 9941]|uniref:Carbon starvation protein CstA n=1 Tax=Rubrobacter xylanophilus (strain DSM 9941 / JCM 11954 / NBRC 16129 / PRD-1) TaxID=266117 RepID=Q1AYY2_RUBXD|nr:carbon starvation CstA family protein [Rubrobacter xylanophilus]ABG03396.1 carbon starvation protein CstA [Rubrobacter xylanophilus DSM 9941]